MDFDISKQFEKAEESIKEKDELKAMQEKVTHNYTAMANALFSIYNTTHESYTKEVARIVLKDIGVTL